MFSLDVCHVLQFYREVLAEPISHNNSLIILDHPWSSLIILDHPWSSLIILDHLVYFGIIWNLDIFLETFGYFWIFWDILEICWRSIIRVSSVIISYIQQICTILTFQYLTKVAFSMNILCQKDAPKAPMLCPWGSGYARILHLKQLPSKAILVAMLVSGSYQFWLRLLWVAGFRLAGQLD